MKQLLTVSEAAALLHLREETVRAYIRRGQLPAVTLPGGYYRIKPGTLQRLLTPKGGKAGVR